MRIGRFSPSNTSNQSRRQVSSRRAPIEECEKLTELAMAEDDDVP